MLRALPKSQQARWLEIGRAFERVRRPARPGEHVDFTPVAEAGTAGRIPTRFPARTARIPSGLRPNFGDAATSPMEASETPAPSVTAEAPPAVEATPDTPSSVASELSAAASTSELAVREEPETSPSPASPTATAAETMPSTADDLPAAHAAESAEPFRAEPFPRHDSAQATDWGGWTSYAARKDFVSDELPPIPEAPTIAVPPSPDASAAPLSPEASPVSPFPSPGVEEHRIDDREPRVSAIEYFRAAPW